MDKDLRLVNEYTESDGRPESEKDEWPYQDEVSEYIVDGELAERVQKIAGSADPVYLEHRAISTGWSEWTSETDYQFKLMCGDKLMLDTTRHSNWAFNALNFLLNWLDEQEKNES